MSKYKYRLLEQEEETGLKGFRTQNELILTTKDKWNADSILDILNDPKFLRGKETAYAEEFSSYSEFKERVFGDRPEINSTISKNINIYKENGKNLYNEIEEKTGKKFDKKGAVIRRDKDQNVQFIFPKYTVDNIKLVEEYYKKEKSSGKELKQIDLKPIKVDDVTIKFPLSDRGNIEKILNNAKLISGKDYKLSVRPSTETIKEIIRKSIK